MYLSISNIDSDKNYYPQVFLEECKYFVKEKNMSENIIDNIKVSSDDSDEENFDKENFDEENSDEENFNEENMFFYF